MPLTNIFYVEANILLDNNVPNFLGGGSCVHTVQQKLIKGYGFPSIKKLQGKKNF